jgi:hypothetical protein
MALVLILVVAGSARADFLGSTMDWQYFAYGGPYTQPNVFVDNGGGVGTFVDTRGTAYFNIIADDNSITFDCSAFTSSLGRWTESTLSLPPTIHNGIAIDMISGPRFGSVTIDGCGRFGIVNHAAFLLVLVAWG